MTYTTIEPDDEGSIVRVIACFKKPEPVCRAMIKSIQGNTEVEHKPDTLIGSHVTIS
jgi:hypothetical protein